MLQHARRTRPTRSIRQLVLLNPLRGQQFQPLARVARMSPGRIALRQQLGRARPDPGLVPVRIQGVKIAQRQIIRQGVQQAHLLRRSATRKTRQRHQRFGTLAALRRAPQYVQAVANLRLLDFAQIGIQPLQQLLAGSLICRGIQPQIQMQAVGQNLLQHTLAQAIGAARIQRQRLVIFVHLLLKSAQWAICFGTRQRRHQVVDDDGLRTALGLAAFARIVHDEGVQMRQRPQNHIGPTTGAQRHAFARQPFQIAVLAHMHDGIGPPYATQPEIKSQIGMRGHQVGIVVAGHHIQIAPTRRLYAHKHIPQPKPCNHEAAAAHHGVLRGRAPQFVYGLLQFGRQCGKVRQVVCHGQALPGGPPVVGPHIIGYACGQARHQRIAVGGHLCKVVALCLQSLQNAHGRSRRIQPHTIGQTRIVIGVVGQNQRQTLFSRGLVAQHTPAPRQLGHKGDAFWLRLVAHHIHLRFFAAPGHAFKADGAGADAPVYFG